MSKEKLQEYIQQRWQELDGQHDRQQYQLYGRLSFGLAEHQYSKLPSWNKFLKARKKLLRLIWFCSFLLVFTVSLFSTDLESVTNWWKLLIRTLLGSAVLTLFYGVTLFFSIAFEVNQVNKLVRRLLYEDLLHRLEENNQEKTGSDEGSERKRETEAG